MLLKEILGEAYNALSQEIKTKYEKANFEDVSEGKYVPKSRLDDEIEKTKGFKTQVTNLETQLTDIKDKFKDAAGLKDEVERLQLENANQKADFEKKINERNFNSALEKALSDYKAKDTLSVIAHLNKENLKLDSDGKTLIGLKEQIDTLQKSHDYLFEKEIEGTSSFNSGFHEGGSDGKKQENVNFAVMLGKQKAKEMGEKTIADFYAK